MTASVFDHPVLSGLFGDDDLAVHFDFGAELDAMLRFEAALATAEARHGIIPGDAAEAIRACCMSFAPDMHALTRGISRDGVIVPELVRQLRAEIGQPHAAHLHVGATSQDVIDSALAMRLGTCLAVLAERLARVLDLLEKKITMAGRRSLTGRTRMRRALPITYGDRFRTWAAPLHHAAQDLDRVRQRVVRLQFGGPVGTLHTFGDEGPGLAATLGGLLELPVPGQCWHSDRSAIVDLGNWLSTVTGALGKMGQDIALMMQDELSELVMDDGAGGGSSAMPGKVNPVGAEILVTMARFNAIQAGGLHQALVHEQERSGAGWSLEWMILPPMVMTTGAALRTALTLLESVQLPPPAD